MLADHPERVQRFGNAMHFYTKDAHWDLSHLLNAFDWKSIDKLGARVVDVGGGFGHVSQVLARATKNIEFIVQDLPQVVQTVVAPTDLENRLKFVVQDFEQPQQDKTPVDAFYLRFIIHNWPEQTGLKILRNLIPALRKGSKILIHEYVLDDSPEYCSPGQLGGLKLDMIMMVAFAGMERTAQQYKELFVAADPGFEFVGVTRPKGSSMSLVEINWNPKE